MGTNAFKQIVRTIQNKIPVSKGLIRRSRETEQGYLADIHNFELEDGTLKFRQGTRLMANMVDELWYDIQSFKFGNTELVMGINYKRELWGWLAKWPETSFKIWNTSPFRRTYPHRTDGGASNPSGHFSFERGNKFYMLEDNFSVILVNDYAEIFRIMKNGCFRITADKDYADQREAIQDARDDDSLREGRIYLDIKEATNKVFNERMYIGDEYIRRSHRITGETRFAWVNELNVVSELSDPIDIEGYRHVVVSKFPVVDYDANGKIFPINRIISYDMSSDEAVYENAKLGIREATLVDNKWHPTYPFSPYFEKIMACGVFLYLEQDGQYRFDDGASVVEITIPKGLYACFALNERAIDGLSSTITPLSVEDDDYNYNILKMSIKSYTQTDLSSDQYNYFIIDTINVLPAMPLVVNSNIPDNALSIPEIVPTLESPAPTPPIPASIVYSDNVGFVTSGGTWIKFKDLSEISKTVKSNNIVISGAARTISFQGALFESRTFFYKDELTDKVAFYNYYLAAIESAITNNVSMWQNKGYDCWDYLGSMQITPTQISLNPLGIVVSSVPDECNATLQGSDELVQNCFYDLNSRFAVWNNSYIQGISQRAFLDVGTGEMIYEDNLSDLSGNQNIHSEDKTIKIIYAPLMTLDYTGLRRIPMPLPMIRRAMRNPQHLTTAGGKVYSVEDNKIWVGSVDDFMMTDFIEIHSAVDHIASMDTGIVVSTRQGLFYVASGEGIKRVIGGEMIMSKFLAPCSGGVLSVDGRDIHIVYKQVTDSGAWYPTVAKINNALTEINLEGEIKSVSIGDMIYIADDWNVWIYDMANKVWAGKRHYKNRIHRLFAYKNKLGVAFETGVDRRNSFNNESWIDR